MNAYSYRRSFKSVASCLETLVGTRVCHTTPATLTQQRLLHSCQRVKINNYACTSLVPCRHFFFKKNEEEMKGPGVENQKEKLERDLGSLKNFFGLGNLIHTTTMKEAGFTLYMTVTEVVNAEYWFKELGLPDTYNSYFLLMELHLWLIMTRLTREGKNGVTVRDSMIHCMWEDMDNKMGKIPGGRKERVKTLKHLYSHFTTAMLAYDEGLLGTDKDLAQAIWCTMYNSEEDVHPRHLEALVMYIRKQVQQLDLHDSRDLIELGELYLLPLYSDEVPLEVYRELHVRVAAKKSNLNKSLKDTIKQKFGKKKQMSSKQIEEQSGLQMPESMKKGP